MSIIGVMRQTTPLKDLVRSTSGTVGKFMVASTELSNFTNSAHVYSERAGGAVEVTSNRTASNQSQVEVTVTVTVGGRGKLKRGREAGWKQTKRHTFRGQAKSLGPAIVTHVTTTYQQLAKDLGISASLAYKNFEVVPDE